jgi:hypothetical protein
LGRAGNVCRLSQKWRVTVMKVYHGSDVKIETVNLNDDIAARIYDYLNGDVTKEIIQIEDLVIEKLMVDKRIDETKATKLFYNSTTFAKLLNKTARFYEKGGTEIYGLLLDEFLKSPNTDAPLPLIDA